MSTRDDSGFLKRWSRLKHEAREQPEGTPPAPSPPPVQNDEPPVLPPVESLTLDSDFSGFLHPKVDEGVRRMALKKLFSDPHFNVMDGLDTYIDDYSITEPLPPGMLEQLEQAKNIMKWSQEDAAAREVAEQAATRQMDETRAGVPSEVSADKMPGAPRTPEST